jgi:hypothetical protein
MLTLYMDQIKSHIKLDLRSKFEDSSLVQQVRSMNT